MPGHTEGEDLEQDEQREFDAKVWIGQGKAWKDPPMHVINARIRDFALCDEWKFTIPSDEALVGDFVNLDFPSASDAFNFTQTSAWLSKDRPEKPTKSLLKRLMSRSVPPADLLNKLEEASKQGWLDGMRSIVDPRFNNGRDRLPLQTLTLWRKMVRLLDVRREWATALLWVSREARIDPLFAKTFPSAEEFVATRGWNSSFTAGETSFTNAKLAQLLAYKELCDDISQLFIHHLQRRLQVHPSLPETHIIAPSRFHLVLRAAATKGYSDKNIPRSLQQVEELVRNGRRYLWFIALSGAHETAHRIDFEARTIEFGMCQ